MAPIAAPVNPSQINGTALCMYVSPEGNTARPSIISLIVGGARGGCGLLLVWRERGKEGKGQVTLLSTYLLALLIRLWKVASAPRLLHFPEVGISPSAWSVVRKLRCLPHPIPLVGNSTSMGREGSVHPRRGRLQQTPCSSLSLILVVATALSWFIVSV